MGESVKPLTKGKLSAYAGPVEQLFSPAHVTMSFSQKQEIREAIIRDKVIYWWWLWCLLLRIDVYPNWLHRSGRISANEQNSNLAKVAGFLQFLIIIIYFLASTSFSKWYLLRQVSWRMTVWWQCQQQCTPQPTPLTTVSLWFIPDAWQSLKFSDFPSGNIGGTGLR